MINIWFLLGLVPTYRMGNGCNAIQNRLSSGRAFMFLLCVCTCVCVTMYKGPVTARVWSGEIKEQNRLTAAGAPVRPSHLAAAAMTPTHWSSWFWFWCDIKYTEKLLRVDVLMGCSNSLGLNHVFVDRKINCRQQGWKNKEQETSHVGGLHAPVNLKVFRCLIVFFALGGITCILFKEWN